MIGSEESLADALLRSEDSEALNTSFSERLNVTIRQSCAYLSRRTLAHARWKDRLEEQLALTRCHYNFLRPHRALKYGKETRTPAMEAGLVSRKLSWRDILTSRAAKAARALSLVLSFKPRIARAELRIAA